MQRSSRIIISLCLITFSLLNLIQTKTNVFAEDTAETRAPIVVSTFVDEYGSGETCSLREAITAANTNTTFGGCPAGSGLGPDIISLSEGIYLLSIPGSGEDNNATGDLDISDDVLIEGLGTNKTYIDGDSIDRVFDVIESPFKVVNVSFESIYIRNGSAPSGAANSNGENGGGIRSTANLFLDQVELYHNYAGNGGNETGNGGHGGGIYCTGELSVSNSYIHHNYAGDGGNIEVNNGTQEFAGIGGDGGGIMVLATASIENSSISFNWSGDAGDGILGEPSYSTYAGNGGGMANAGTTSIISSEFNANRGGDGGEGPSFDGHAGHGGGIYNTGGLTIENSTLLNNRTGNGTLIVPDGYGSGIYNSNTGTVIITSSGIHNNGDEYNDHLARGGGIYNNGEMSIVNSTIADNEQPYYGGGIYNAYYGILDINASTIAWNQSQKGGGIYIESSPSGSVTIKNTLISWNVGWQGGYDCEGSVVSGGYSFVRDLTEKVGGPPYSDVCFISGVMTGVITGTENNPLISAIGYYGSETKSYLPLSGSPLVDAGNPLSPGSGGNACPATDQRGVSRPQSTYCDIGASEATEQFSVTKNVDVVHTFPGQLITFNITVENNGALTSSEITVSDELPGGLVFHGPVTLDPSHPEATVALTALDLPDLVTGLELDPDETVTIYLPVTTEISNPGGEMITNIARAFSPIPQSEGFGQKNIWTGWILYLPILTK